MRKMKPEKLLNLFEELADKLNINIAQGKGDFQGGMCSVNEEAYIVLNIIKPLDQRLGILAREVGKLDLGNVFVPPILRAYIEGVQQDIF
jgi:hypothetical protein